MTEKPLKVWQPNLPDNKSPKTTESWQHFFDGKFNTSSRHEAAKESWDFILMLKYRAKTRVNKVHKNWRETGSYWTTKKWNTKHLESKFRWRKSKMGSEESHVLLPNYSTLQKPNFQKLFSAQSQQFWSTHKNVVKIQKCISTDKKTS